MVYLKHAFRSTNIGKKPIELAKATPANFPETTVIFSRNAPELRIRGSVRRLRIQRLKQTPLSTEVRVRPGE